MSSRLLDERGVHHGFVGVKDKTHDTAPGKPSIGTDTAHSGSGSHGHKLSIGERIKGICIPSWPPINGADSCREISFAPHQALIGKHGTSYGL